MTELTEDMLRLHRALEVEPSAYWSEVADKAEAVQHEKQAYFNHWRNVIEKLQQADADLAVMRTHYNAALDRVRSERTRLEESQTLAEERLVSIGHWKAANEEAQRERDEARAKLTAVEALVVQWMNRCRAWRAAGRAGSPDTDVARAYEIAAAELDTVLVAPSSLQLMQLPASECAHGGACGPRADGSCGWTGGENG